jgi:hypothetical protein
LPVADSCKKCNLGFSFDEEYLACLIECVFCGTTEQTDKFRDKVAKTLKARPTIASRIEKGKKFDQKNSLAWQPEWSRIRRVVLKLARGHISYELGLIDILPIPLMTKEDLEQFNSLEEYKGLLYPEIGSRAFVNLLSSKPTAYGNWGVVQEGRYRYAIGQSSGDWVKFVIGEYLACRVVWD